MSENANKTDAAKTGPRFGWFWFGAASGMMGLVNLMDFLATHSTKPDQDSRDNPPELLMAFTFAAIAAFSMCILGAAYSVLKKFGKNAVVSQSHHVWLASGFLCAAIFVLTPGIWLLLPKTMEPSDTVFHWLMGADFFGGPVLILLLHVFFSKSAKPEAATPQKTNTPS